MVAQFVAPLITGVIGALGASQDRKQSKKALKTQQAQNASNAKFLAKQTAKAEGQITNLFGASQSNQQEGFKRALEILGQTIPQQLSTFQQGNVGAQEQLLAGLPQIQNALLGRQVDLSGLQPKQVQFDPSFTQQKIPFFQDSRQALEQAGAPGRLAVQNSAFQNQGLDGVGFFQGGAGTNRPANLNFGGNHVL